MKGIAVFQGKLKGSYCTFYQDSPNLPVKINGHINNLVPGKHGFHVHTYGNLLNDSNSHVGDLGNITANEEGESKFHIKSEIMTLYGKNSILGRSIVIHEGIDDLGKGGFSDSLTTGHSGARIDCAVIGYA